MTANKTTADDGKSIASYTNTDDDTGTNTGQQELGGNTDNTDTLQYHCPHCDKHYTNETLTRVHVTRSDDAAHVNRDGFMPETEIRVTDTNCNTINTATTRPRDTNPETITADDLPDDLTDRHKLILLAATHNPHETEYTELKNLADELINEHGHEPLSYATVRRVIRRFYRPDTSDRAGNTNTNTSTGNNENELSRIEQINQHGTLTDLTPKQQAIIIATTIHPDDSNVDIADRIGTAQSYPSQVTSKFNRICDRITARIDDGTAPATAISTDLTDTDIETLAAENLLANIDITVDNLNTETVYDRGVSEQNNVMSASPYDTGTADTTSTDTDNTATEKESSNNDTATEPATAPTPTTSTADTLINANTDGEKDDVESDRDGDVEHDSDVRMIPCDEIEQLKEHVAFERRLAERTAEIHEEPQADQTPRIAFARVMENELERILAK